MKLKNMMHGGLLAVALIALSASSAKAGNSATYSDGDWLLGFYDPSSSTGATDFIYDLGAHTINSGFTLADTTSNIAADLTLAFGSGWYTNPNVYYGLVQTFNGPGSIIISNPDAANQGPWGSGGTNGPSSDIATLAAQFTNHLQYPGETSSGLIQTGTSGFNFWYQYVADAASPHGALDGNYTNPDNAGDGAISANPGTSLELDYLRNSFSSSPVVEGTISVDSSGDVSFVAAPEPSTYASIGLGAAVLILAGRRRRNRSAA